MVMTGCRRMLVETGPHRSLRPPRQALADKALAPDLPPPEAARAARLRCVADREPGISRRRSGKAFAYRDAQGRALRDAATLARAKALAVPSALDGGVDLRRPARPPPGDRATCAGASSTAITRAGGRRATRPSTSTWRCSAARCRACAAASSRICGGRIAAREGAGRGGAAHGMHAGAHPQELPRPAGRRALPIPRRCRCAALDRCRARADARPRREGRAGGGPAVRAVSARGRRLVRSARGARPLMVRKLVHNGRRHGALGRASVGFTWHILPAPPRRSADVRDALGCPAPMPPVARVSPVVKAVALGRVPGAGFECSRAALDRRKKRKPRCGKARASRSAVGVSRRRRSG